MNHVTRALGVSVLLAGALSAQIVTILGTDTLTDSRTTINNNFAWLRDNRAALSHVHLVADVTGLQAALDGKASSTHNHDAVYAGLSHTHTIANVTNLQTNLDGKASSTHNHDATYAPISHNHAASAITSGVFPVARLGTGTPDGTKFLRDDGVFAVPAGGGGGVGSSSTGQVLVNSAGAVAGKAQAGNGSEIATVTGTKTATALTMFDNSGNVIATGCTYSAGVINCPQQTTGGGIEFTEGSGNGSNKWGVYIPDALTADRCIVLPDAQPTNGQVLAATSSTSTKNGLTCQVMQWTTPAGGTSPALRVLAYEIAGTGTAGVLQAADFTASFAAAINDGNAKTLTGAYCMSDTGSQSVTVSVGGSARFSLTCVPSGSFSTATTNGTTGYIIPGSMTNTTVAAHAVLDITGTANGTTKVLKIFAYGTVN